jgi:hypothetical protein
MHRDVLIGRIVATGNLELAKIARLCVERELPDLSNSNFAAAAVESGSREMCEFVRKYSVSGINVARMLRAATDGRNCKLEMIEYVCNLHRELEAARGLIAITGEPLPVRAGSERAKKEWDDAVADAFDRSPERSNRAVTLRMRECGARFSLNFLRLCIDRDTYWLLPLAREWAAQDGVAIPPDTLREMNACGVRDHPVCNAIFLSWIGDFGNSPSAQ